MYLRMYICHNACMYALVGNRRPVCMAVCALHLVYVCMRYACMYACMHEIFSKYEQCRYYYVFTLHEHAIHKWRGEYADAAKIIKLVILYITSLLYGDIITIY